MHFFYFFILSISLLSTLHRSLITLSALHLGHGPRAVVLAANQVTEADLRKYYTQWQRLQVLHQAQQARYQPDVQSTNAIAWSEFPPVGFAYPLD